MTKHTLKIGESVTIAEKTTSNRRTTDWTANDPTCAIELKPREDGGIDVVAVHPTYLPAIILGNGDEMAEVSVTS